MTVVSAPASSSACFGFVSSASSKPLVAKMATRSPLSVCSAISPPAFLCMDAGEEDWEVACGKSKRRAAARLLGSFRLPLRVRVAQLSLLAHQWDLAPGNEDVLDVSLEVERITVGDDDVGCLAHIQRSELVINAPHLRGIESDRLQRLLVRKAVSDGITGGVRQVARI